MERTVQRNTPETTHSLANENYLNLCVLYLCVCLLFGTFNLVLTWFSVCCWSALFPNASKLEFNFYILLFTIKCFDVSIDICVCV